MALLLGIDIGTSSAKAVLYDPEMRTVIAAAGQEYPIHQPMPDRSEQNPEDWWNAAVSVTQRVIAESGRRDVAGIGLCGQMHGVTLVDGAGLPVRPSIIWADQRCGEEVKALVEMIGAARYAQIAGTLPAVGFTAPLLLWLKRHEPESLEHSHALLFPKDYVRLRMTGEIASEPSDAAASGIFAVAESRWADEIIGAAKLPTHILPPLLRSDGLAGHLTKQAADELGLAAGIPVAAGCADQPAQALANGLIAPGKASITVGSGGQVCSPLRMPVNGVLPTDPRLHVFNHAVPQTWYVLGAILSAGLSLRWLRRAVGLEGREDAYALFSQEAAGVAAGSNGLIFLPYLTGERTPHMDGQARGAFIGLTSYHERAHLARAVMEGVSFALRQALELSLALGGGTDVIIMAGGAAESETWRGILADVIGIPLRKSLMREQAGVGAALLGGMAAGVFTDVESASLATAQYSEQTMPNLENQRRYLALYEQFCGLYPLLKGEFGKLGQA